MANRKPRSALSTEEIALQLDELDEDDDNVSDLEMDGIDEQEDVQGELIREIIFNGAGEVIEVIEPRYVFNRYQRYGRYRVP